MADDPNQGPYPISDKTTAAGTHAPGVSGGPVSDKTTAMGSPAIPSGTTAADRTIQQPAPDTNRPTDFTGAPATNPAPAAEHKPGQLAPGAIIGNYRIIRVLGEGGMGVVFEAEQQNPRRQVALKIINTGVASTRMLQRFQYEAQVLGKLQHPNIAHIFEAGTFTTASGTQPFFAMEFIEGKPLNEHVAEKKLGTRQRLELMIKICQAVQHAHQKGIIHRDLKPGNIIVDRFGQPKILDFGVARATDSDVQTATQQTDIGQLIGTIPYMSPEQATGDPTELDTRSDVYALGVVFYELLAGKMPYDLQRRMIHEAVRVIREEDPAPLSSINKVFKGDVETIVAKALEKARETRYQTAQDLGADIERYLKFEPIIARPHSTWYQVRKFARRNRTLVGSLAAILFISVTGGLICLNLYLEAERARAAEEVQRRTAQAVNHFLNDDLLASIDPNHARGRQVTVREVLDNAAKNIQGKFAAQPEVEASIRTTLGHTYRNLGEFAPSEPHLLRAVELMTQVRGPDDPQTIAARNQLAALYWSQSRFTEAEPIWIHVHDYYLKHNGPEHQQTILAMNNLALLRRDQGKLAEAKEMFTQALEGSRKVLGPDHPTTLTTMNNLAWLHRGAGDYDKAAGLYDQVLAVRLKSLGEDHPETIQAMSNLAWLCHQQAKLDKAEPLMEKVFELSRKVLGPEHPDTLGAQLNLGLLKKEQGQFKQAEELMSTAVKGKQRVLGDAHSDTLSSQNNLASLYFSLGRYAEAEALWKKSLDSITKTLGPDHPSALTALVSLATVHRAQGRYASAEPMMLKAVKITSATLGPTHPQTISSTNNLASLYWVMGKLKEAEPLWKQVLEATKKQNGPDHPNTILATGNLALISRDLGRFDLARPLLAEARESALKNLDKNNPTALMINDLIVYQFLAEKKYQEAASPADQAVLDNRRVFGPEHYRTLTAMNNLALVYRGLGKPDQAAQLAQTVHESRKKLLGPAHPDTLYSIHTLAMIRRDQKQFDTAQAMARMALENRIKTLGDKHPETLNSKHDLALICEDLQQTDTAEKLLLDAAAGRAQTLGDAHPQTLESIQELVGLYRDTNRTALADQWQSKLPSAASLKQ